MAKKRLNSLYVKEIVAVVLLLSLSLFMVSYQDFVATGYQIADFGKDAQGLPSRSGSQSVIVGGGESATITCPPEGGQVITSIAAVY